MGVMGMSHAGGEGWMGTQRPLPTTLGSVVEQGCTALAQPFSSGWLRGHPTSYHSACSRLHSSDGGCGGRSPEEGLQG